MKSYEVEALGLAEQRVKNISGYLIVRSVMNV